MRAAVYARYSSENQRPESIDDQVAACRRLAAEKGLTVLEDHIYSDQARSGARSDREGLSALVEAARAGQFEAVLVDDLSRLARDNYLMLSVLAELHFEGVRVISVADGLDSGDEDSTLAILDYNHVDAPIYYRDEVARWEIVLGQAVMPMTVESGNPNPDSYVYVYGPRNSSGPKQLVAARVLPEQIEDFDQWSYWDGTDWVGDISSCANITAGISQEFSVTPLADGRCLVVFQVGNQVGIRFGAGPTGPFEFYDLIYDCPEPQQDPDIFVYNAKAHPHLSAPGELLISYNVNSSVFGDFFIPAEINRAGLIRLSRPTKDTLVVAAFGAPLPVACTSNQNYPNPFNPATTVEFDLPQAAPAVLAVYDLRGREIVRLLEGNLPAGRHQAEWNGQDRQGRNAPSGIYIARLAAGDQAHSIKMALLR